MYKEMKLAIGITFALLIQFSKGEEQVTIYLIRSIPTCRYLLVLFLLKKIVLKFINIIT